MKHLLSILLSLVIIFSTTAQDSTYAGKLGFPKNARVIILHMDDAGMCYSSDRGIEKVFSKGIANSTSVMMTCPWVPQIVRYIQENPETDAGLHLTLTSEWKDYRWGPVAGAATVPGLVDSTGSLWPDVPDVVRHASAEEVDKEIRTQLARAEKMGFHPTHMDSHMGTIFGSNDFIMKYIQLGIEKQIPVMFPGGNDFLIQDQRKIPDAALAQFRQLGTMIWNAGLPVLDDLHNYSYDWKMPEGMKTDDASLCKWRVALYEETLQKMKPGVAMVIMHCTDPTDVFSQISDSGDIRKADMLAMLDPGFKKFLQDNGFILTTWHELMQRRQKLK